MPDAIKIDQKTEGYRHSVEPFLLADFIRPSGNSRILDIGTGCGVIPILLAGRYPDVALTGIEIQETLYDQAISNISENGFGHRVQLHHCDFLEWGAGQQRAFDIILSNPPYRALNSGRLNPVREKAIARHELTLTLSTLVSTAVPLLAEGGTLALAYPPNRLAEVASEYSKHGLRVQRIVHIQGHEGVEPRIVMIEGTQSNTPKKCQEETWVLCNPDSSYTHRLQEIYVSFNHPVRSHSLREK